MKCCCIILGFAKMLPGDLKTETVVDLFCSQHTTQAVFNETQMAIRPNNSVVVPVGAHRKRSGELLVRTSLGRTLAGLWVEEVGGRKGHMCVWACVGVCGPLLQPVVRTVHVRRTNTHSSLHTHDTEGMEERRSTCGRFLKQERLAMHNFWGRNFSRIAKENI